MNVEVVFNKQTTVPYTRMDAVRGFLLAHRLRPCCGLCGCQNVSLVAMRFMLELGQNSSNELIAATFNHLNKREQTLVLELFSEPEYAVLLEKSKKIWSYSVKNLAGEARPESQSQPATSFAVSSPEKRKLDAEFQKISKAAAEERANDLLNIDTLLPYVKADGVMLHQLFQLRNLIADRLCNRFMESKRECSLVSFTRFIWTITYGSDLQDEVTREFVRNPEYKELKEFLQFMSTSGKFSRRINEEFARFQPRAPVVNPVTQPTLADESTSAMPQEAIEKPCETHVSVVVEKTSSSQPTYHYNLRPRKLVV